MPRRVVRMRTGLGASPRCTLTAAVIFGGFAIAMVIGMVLGIWMATSEHVNAIADNFIAALYPLPKVTLSPWGDQVVNLPSWLWIENWEPLSGTASVGGVTIRVIARPASARWTFGDGTTLSCGPGVPWSPDTDATRACIHTWTRSSASQPAERYLLRVSVTWSASYSVTGGAGGGALPSITRTSTQPVRVAEIQALNDRIGG